jgi:hypothetical protein
MALQIVNGPVIEAGESLSDGVDCTGGNIVRITMPASWESGNLTFQISSDGEGYNDLFNYDGEEITMVVMPGAAIVIHGDLATNAALAYVKFRSGTRESPVVQEERREFSIALHVPDAPAARR